MEGKSQQQKRTPFQHVGNSERGRCDLKEHFGKDTKRGGETHLCRNELNNPRRTCSQGWITDRGSHSPVKKGRGAIKLPSSRQKDHQERRPQHPKRINIDGNESESPRKTRGDEIRGVEFDGAKVLKKGLVPRLYGGCPATL